MRIIKSQHLQNNYDPTELMFKMQDEVLSFLRYTNQITISKLQPKIWELCEKAVKSNKPPKEALNEIKTFVVRNAIEILKEQHI